MNEIQCPQCSVVNPASAKECRQCRFSFGGLPASSSFTRENETFPLRNPAFQTVVAPDNQTGRKTYFWYRIYCSFLAILYSALAVLGAVAIAGSYGVNVDKPADAFRGGVILLAFGGIFAVIYLTGVILSPRPASWIFGIVLIALGMTSVCFLPFVLPLLIFWLKPETQIYFGRKK